MKILIADDSKTMRHVLISQLKEIGYDTFLEADCVDKAQRLCQAETPTLIISDWNMPGASGLVLLKFIRSNPSTKDVPFIMVTTETDRNKIVEATRSGLQTYLLKPIKKHILFEKMTELSIAYGFTRPIDTGAVSAPITIVQEDNHPLKGKIKNEQIAKILEVFGKVWKKESSIAEFEVFIAREIFGGSPEEKFEDLTLFMKTMQSASLDAIDFKLKQIVN